MSERPMMTLDFILTIQDDFPPDYGIYTFPLMVFDTPYTTAYLIPIPICHEIFTNLDELMPTVEEKCAYVSIPYSPPEADDEVIYSFGVYLLHVPNDTPAIADMLALDMFKRQIWQRHNHLAMPFDNPDDES